MLLKVKPDGGSMIITFPDDAMGYAVLTYSVKSKFNWKFWKGRKKFYLTMLENSNNIPKEIPDHNLRSSYSNEVKYKPERCLYIYNPHGDGLEVHIEMHCFTKHELYNHRNITSVSGI